MSMMHDVHELGMQALIVPRFWGTKSEYAKVSLHPYSSNETSTTNQLNI